MVQKIMGLILIAMMMVLPLDAQDAPVTDCSTVPDRLEAIRTTGGVLMIACDGLITLNDMVIEGDVTIIGGIFDGLGTYDIATIEAGGSLILDGVTIQNGINPLTNRGTLTIINSTFTNNNATSGGAIHNQDAILTILDSHFEDNRAEEQGGAIFADNSALAILNSTFEANEADTMGGVIFASDSTLTIHQSELGGNTADQAGALRLINNQTTIHASIFHNNLALVGGAIVTQLGNITLTESEFWGNDATNGGALYTVRADVTLRHTVIGASIVAFAGSALYNEASTVSIINSVFTDNRNREADGVIFTSNGTVTIIHSTFGNSEIPSDAVLMAVDGGIIHVSYSLLAGDLVCGAGIVVDATNLVNAPCGAGTVLADAPLFARSEDGFILLPDSSPAIDFYPAPCAVPTDWKGVARPMGA
ncbi:MAG: hypothetical protein KJ043_20750, partial [Anaerolineae bacterium]|nr:hypothetical protein [Anaerolineae bacterium]